MSSWSDTRLIWPSHDSTYISPSWALTADEQQVIEEYTYCPSSDGKPIMFESIVLELVIYEPVYSIRLQVGEYVF